MRLPRITTRRWMIAVAVVGIALGTVETLRRRNSFYNARASYHAREAVTFTEEAESLWVCGTGRSRADIEILSKKVEQEKVRLKQMALSHNRMATEYQHAALQPWRSVVPAHPEWSSYRRRADRYAGLEQSIIEEAKKQNFEGKIKACREQAARCAENARKARLSEDGSFGGQRADQWEKDRDFWIRGEADIVEEAEKQPERTRRMAAYYTQLREKYERAAVHPWLSVPPDPPEAVPVPPAAPAPK